MASSFGGGRFASGNAYKETGDNLSNYLGSGVQESNNEYSYAAMEYANQLEQNNARYANEIAQENATIAYERQKELQQMAMDFNASEAEKARAYDTQMSNTAYQRAVADMKAAGINPILAFSNGGAAYSGGQAATIGASTASQASSYMASTKEQQIDQTSKSEISKTRLQIVGNLLSTFINAASRVQSAQINAISNSLKSISVLGG